MQQNRLVAAIKFHSEGEERKVNMAKNRLTGYVQQQWPIYAGVLIPTEPTTEEIQEAWQNLLSFQDTAEAIENYYDSVQILTSDKNPRRDVIDTYLKYLPHARAIFSITSYMKSQLSIENTYVPHTDVPPQDELISVALRVFTSFGSVVESVDEFYEAIQTLRRAKSQLDESTYRQLVIWNETACKLYNKVHSLVEIMDEAIAQN